MKKSILTIVDSTALNYVFTTIFKKDFDVVSVSTYNEAFQHLRSNRFDDLIIINIPDTESDNFRFLAHMNSSSLFRNIPKVVISKSGDRLLKKKAIALGASFFFQKPFDPAVLCEKVRELTREKSEPVFFNQN